MHGTSTSSGQAELADLARNNTGMMESSHVPFLVISANFLKH